MRALAPARRGTFLCSAKEKHPKERRPGGLPATRAPCASRENRRLLNSRSRYARTLKHTQASSGFHCDARLRLREGQTLNPLYSPSTAANPGNRCAPCLREIMGQSPVISRVVRAPGLARNAGDRRQPVSAPGAILFGYFLLGKQEKVPRRAGARARI